VGEIEGGRLDVAWLGRVAYGEALGLQGQVLEARRRGRIRDRLLLLEHPPVVTLGRGAHEANLLMSREQFAARGIELHGVARGGDVTYHAPGQLVGYLIVDLAARDARDVRAFLRRVEQALIEALGEIGVPGRRIDGRTGVFVEPGSERRSASGSGARRERKIASIGVGLRHWVTCHGFALNVSVDLTGFEAIVPCGLADIEMTSVERELGRGALGLDARVREIVAEAFRAAFA